MASEIYVKLSEMDRPAKPVNDSDLVFIAQSESGVVESKAMAVSDLRALLNFENGYATTSLGLADTAANQIFYVYTDSNKIAVNAYVNRSGIAEPVLDNNSVKKVFYTQKGIDLLHSFMGAVSGTDGASEIGYKTTDAGSVLSRMQTVQDQGGTPSHLGFNQTEDQALFTEQRLKNTNLRMYGGLMIGRQSRGVRQNSVGLSVRMNQSSNGYFNTQATGVSNSIALKKYGMRDSVSGYFDCSSLPYSTWEDCSAATYTANTVLPSAADSTVWANTLVGDVIETKHDPSWMGLVTAKNPDGSLQVDGWCNDGLAYSTPTDGVGFYLNPSKKAWVLNSNLFFPANGRSTFGVIQENGIQNNKVADTNDINGIDNVVLGGTYPCNVAFLSRGSSGMGWKIGYMAQGSRDVQFHSFGGVFSPKVSFYDQSGASTGLRFRGNNTVASIEWANTSDFNLHSDPYITAAIDPTGRWLKKVKNLTIITSANSGTLGAQKSDVVINTATKAIVLPAATNVSAGFYIEFFPYSSSTLTFTAEDGKTINGVTSYTAITRRRSSFIMIFDGSGWIDYGMTDLRDIAQPTIDLPSIAAGGIYSQSFNLTSTTTVGCNVDVYLSISRQGLKIWADVTATGVVTVYFQNPTTAAIDLPSAVLTLQVKRY